MTDEPTRSLFISNIPFNVKTSDLHDKFVPYGIIDRIDIPNHNGTMRGFAFIHFSEVEDAVAAMKGLDGEPFFGRSLKIQYSNKEIPEKKPHIKRPPNRYQRDMPRSQNMRNNIPMNTNPNSNFFFPSMMEPFSSVPIPMQPQPMAMTYMNIPQTIPMPMQMTMPMQLSQNMSMFQQIPMAMAMQMPMQMQMPSNFNYGDNMISNKNNNRMKNQNRDRKRFDSRDDDRSMRNRY